MAIVVDRRYLEHLIDILEDGDTIDPELRINMIAQGRRLVQVEVYKENGKLNGRPSKSKEERSVTFEKPQPQIKFCEFLSQFNLLSLKRKKEKKIIENEKQQLSIDFNF